MSETFKISRQQLYAEIWETAPSRVAVKHNISYPDLKAVCGANNIPMPPQSYWRDRRKGKAVAATPLPDSDIKEIEIKTVSKRSGKPGASLGSSANAVCLLKILENYSDENNILTMRHITHLMESVYRLKVDRRTVYSSIELLKRLGYVISDFEDNKIGYFLTEKDFEAYEIKVLYDSLALNPTLPAKIRSEIRYKLGRYIAKPNNDVSFRRIVGNECENHNNGLEFFYIIDTVDLAVSQSRKIEFTYMKHDVSGKLIPLREEKFKVSPYKIMARKYTYYLLSTGEKKDSLARFRIDMIRDLRITDEPADPIVGFGLGYTVEDHTTNDIEFVSAVIKCKMELLERVYEDFEALSNKMKTVDNEDGETFNLHIKGGLTSLSHWAAGFADLCEVLEPAVLRGKVIDIIKKKTDTFKAQNRGLTM